MLKLKGCPRCKKGDITFDRDEYGWYEYCLQCGYTRDLEIIIEAEHHQPCRGKERERRDITLTKRK